MRTSRRPPLKLLLARVYPSDIEGVEAHEKMLAMDVPCILVMGAPDGTSTLHVPTDIVDHVDELIALFSSGQEKRAWGLIHTLTQERRRQRIRREMRTPLTDILRKMRGGGF